MADTLFDVPLCREFALLPAGQVRLPNESTILHFHHPLERHGLAAQMLQTVHAILAGWELLLMHQRFPCGNHRQKMSTAAFNRN
ncbi:hypothetical protein THIX_30270 [Thiomonas sp. X19]|nr:hypothetical protein THIX_30270 [Thiomonas sp. X19]